jgi:PAS domain S-box-containing protein
MSGSSELYRALIENSSDAIFLLNPEREIVYANASTAKVLGYLPEEIVGRNGLELVHPQDRDHSDRALKEVLAKPRCPLQTNARVRRRDGRWCWMESTASNLLDEPDVRAILVSSREIEARRAAEEVMRQHVEELARSNDELQAYAHTVAHDLREPLRMISAFTAILVRKAQLDDDGKEVASFIVNGATRMSALLNDLLASATYGHIDPPHRVELEHAVEQARENLRPILAASGTTIKVERLPIVQGHEGDLVRVFQNLIANAVKYRSEAPVAISVTAERFGRNWVIKIKDNGIGIPPEQRQRVFGLFTRLHTQDIPGTGIGLAVCKKIIDRLGGTIWVESEPGAGSTFCFTLTPAKDESKIAVSSDSDRYPHGLAAKRAEA